MTDAAETIEQETTRSEERLVVTTERIPIGRAVLRKTIVVEQRTITVEVRHEEVSLEVVPFDEARTAEPDDVHGAHLALPEFVLHQEEVVVTRRIVPVERVRLGLTPVTTNRTITEDVRHEEIAVDLTDAPPRS